MFLPKSLLKDNQTIEISGSKSISNRLLILSKLFGDFTIHNLSDAKDTEVLRNALHTERQEIDIHHAGTAMRFLTSFYAIFEGRTTILTGSERMKQRPIQDLVCALQNLGAEISYIEKEGFPPLRIIGKKLQNNTVQISSEISSQFISSLLLIGAKMPQGLVIELLGETTSKPYIEMTIFLMKELGISCNYYKNYIKVLPANNIKLVKSYTVESDWSSASYFYSMAAIGRKKIHLKSFKSKSYQGDAVVKEFYWKLFGINTITDAEKEHISLIPENNFVFPEKIEIDLNDCPDIAQTICVTATALKIPFNISGLKTLKIKETDRLLALQKELKKIGGIAKITHESISCNEFKNPNKKINIKTYEDHRMAMSFAPFCLIQELNIENEQVVEKSYPDFWKDFLQVIMN